MKLKIMLVTILVSIICGCASPLIETANDSDESNLVGVWDGERDMSKTKNNCEFRSWQIYLKKNGTYDLLLYYDQARKKLSEREQGKWWVSNGKFYSINPKRMTSPDVYVFYFQDPNTVTYKTEGYDLTGDCRDNDYQFTEHRNAFEDPESPIGLPK